MSRIDELLLNDIREALKLINEFVDGMSFDQFSEDLRTQSAVVRQLEIIGEAAKRVSDATRVGYPSVPWSTLARMRDKLIHAYHSVDPQVVWDTVETDLPTLSKTLSVG